MNPLTFDEIVEAFSKGELLAWHPEYDFQAWKDGVPPLTIIHCSFLSEIKNKKNKLVKHYFVGYRCSKPDCSRCNTVNESMAVGPHHNIILADGLATFKKVESIEKKKSTITQEHDDPVFVKYVDDKLKLDDWAIMQDSMTMAALESGEFVPCLHLSGRLDNKQIFTSDLIFYDLNNREAIAINGSRYELLVPNAKWLKWLENNGFKYMLDVLSEACCSDPQVRGGMCVSCGEWVADETNLSQGDNEG